jgi:hypothetical protein
LLCAAKKFIAGQVAEHIRFYWAQDAMGLRLS